MKNRGRKENDAVERKAESGIRRYGAARAGALAAALGCAAMAAGSAAIAAGAWDAVSAAGMAAGAVRTEHPAEERGSAHDTAGTGDDAAVGLRSD